MTDKTSIDTNILVYAYQDEDVVLKQLAIEVLKKVNVFVSHFAYIEFLHYLKVTAKMKKKELMRFGSKLLEGVSLNISSRDTYLYAYNLLVRYDFQYKDSIIVADAILNNCKILYSRDMQNQQIIDKKLIIVNPFY